jgi:hypothetical protein
MLHSSGMEKTLGVLNTLEQEGIIRRYAIGGAMAATFYAEPVLTLDLDVFVLLPETAGGLLTLAPIEVGECVLIEGVPVQFLPVYNTLLEEALQEAQEIRYEETPTRVLRAEHLIVIAMQTGREKDHERVRMLTEQAPLDREYLSAILERHGIQDR